MYTCVFEDGTRETIPDDQFQAVGCPPEAADSYYPLAYSYPGPPREIEDIPNIWETPPWSPIETEPWPETPPYTLPVEIFERIKPIFVPRPEPVMMPIPTTLPEYAPPPVQQAGVSPWLVAALVGGVVLATTTRRKK